jgi:hypothetical protein
MIDHTNKTNSQGFTPWTISIRIRKSSGERNDSIPLAAWTQPLGTPQQLP